MPKTGKLPTEKRARISPRKVRRAPQTRQEKTAATRSAIVEAALEEFSTRGFAAARLDDVARRAGVAKGTIYVHFRDREALFEALVRSALGPVIGAAEAAPIADMPFRQFVERLIETLISEVFESRRRDVVRLIISEGERFPQLSRIYYREVIKRALVIIRGAAKRAIDRGEIASDALIRFPQLVVAPALLAMLWQTRFARFEPLDVKELMRTHLKLLFAALERRSG